VFKRKRRELASNAIEDETKKIENERSAFQHNLNEARATIRRVESFVEKSTSQQTIAALKKQLESARIVEEDNIRNLANLSATKAERLTEIQDSAEFAAVLFCEDLERNNGVSSFFNGTGFNAVVNDSVRCTTQDRKSKTCLCCKSGRANLPEELFGGRRNRPV